jgi:hypothetical protein
MSGDDDRIVALQTRPHCDRLRRGFYILTEHASGVRQRPSMEAAVIGMLYAVNGGLPAYIRDPGDRMLHPGDGVLLDELFGSQPIWEPNDRGSSAQGRT